MLTTKVNGDYFFRTATRDIFSATKLARLYRRAAETLGRQGGVA
jgi:hypothetical protein